MKRQNAILSANQKKPHTGARKSAGGSILNGASQPPRNNIVVVALRSIMLAYSPRKKSAKLIDEYSVLKPPTSSDSPSGRSNGWRLVSASAEIKNTMNMGNKIENTNQPCVCASTILLRFSEPTHNNTVIITRPMETS